MGIADAFWRATHPRALSISPSPAGMGAILTTRRREEPIGANTLLIQSGPGCAADAILGAASLGWASRGLPLAVACDESGWSRCPAGARLASCDGREPLFMGRNLCSKLLLPGRLPHDQSLGWRGLDALARLEARGSLMARFHSDEIERRLPDALADAESVAERMAWAIARSPHPILLAAMFRIRPWGGASLRALINACHASGSTFILALPTRGGHAPPDEDLFDASACMAPATLRGGPGDDSARARAEELAKKGGGGPDSALRSQGIMREFDSRATEALHRRRFALRQLRAQELRRLEPANPTESESERGELGSCAGPGRSDEAPRRL